MAFDDGVKTVSGSVAHTDDAATKVPFVSVKCGIEPTLTGVSQLVATQTGENLFDKTTVTDNTCIVVNDTTTESAVGYRTSDYIPVKANTKYFVSTKSSNRSAYYDQNKNGIAYFSFSGGASFTCLYDGYIRITIKNDIDLNTFIVNEGNTAITYEPYNGTTYTANLGRTVHCGTAGLVSGEGSEQGYKVVVDGTNLYFAKAGNYYNSYPRTLPTLGNPWKLAQSDEISFGYNSNYGGFIFLTVARAEELGLYSAEEVNAYFAQNPTTIILNLATPTDFTFTPITPTPETVGKVNNVYCNTGDTELTYYDNAHGFAEVTVNKTGKNLFDISKVATTGTTAGISWSVSGNEITISGTATSSGWKTFVEFKLPHKGTYHFHMNATGNVGYFLRGWTQLVGKDVTEVCNDPSQVYRIAIAVTTAGQTYEGTISEIQIEVGDAYSSYEPYEAVSKTAYLHKVIYGGTADVIRGTCEPKNPLKLYLARTSHQGINFSLTDEGLLHMEGTNTSATSSAFSGGNYSTYDACPWKFPAGTYTASSLITADTSKVGSVNFLIRTKTNNVNYSYALKDAPKTFTISDDFGAWFWASVLKTETVNCDVGVQLEKGSTASDFAPYFDPFTFTPISMETDEGENTLFANEGDSSITYRKAVE